MKIILAVNHPAQYHLLKHVYRYFEAKQHEVVFVISEKDILLDLMKSDQVSFHVLSRKRQKKGKTAILLYGFIGILIHNVNLFRYVRKFRADIMVGTDYSITHVGKLFGIPSVVLNEDDFAINKFFCKLAYPLATAIVSPVVCNVGKYQSKKIAYQGYQKLSYLHPKLFVPDPEIVSKYISLTERFFLIRLVSFSAGHDIEMKHSGINEENLIRLINLLTPYGRVFISSESKVSDQIKPYMLKIDLKHIHHIMSYASLIIGDSQSMIVEAALLGTPSVRFNSFVGKIAVLEELEKKYQLTIGVHSDNPELLFRTVNELLAVNDLKSIYQKRKEIMLSEKINVTEFLIWFIENFPKSRETMRSNPDYQLNFK
jgi:uncharacterized protein